MKSVFAIEFLCGGLQRFFYIKVKSSSLSPLFFLFFFFFCFSVWSLAQKTWFACDGLFVPHVFQMLSVSKNIYGVFQVVRHSDVTKQGSSES